MKGKTVLLTLFIAAAPLTSSTQVLVKQWPISTPNAPDPDAILRTDGTEGGFLMPRMTESQRLAIAAPVEGLTLYQTDQKKGYYVYSDPAWIHIAAIRKEAGVIKIDQSSQVIMATLGDGFTASQGGAGSMHEVNIFFDTPFDTPPNVVVSGEPLPPFAPGLIQYCDIEFSDFCNTFVAADYLDDVIVNSYQGGVLNPLFGITDIGTNCNLEPDNYVDNTANPSLEVTLYGTCGPGGAGNYFDLGMRSSHEWPDDLDAYIDWNQDGDFNDSNEQVLFLDDPFPFDLLYFENGIVVPANAVNGQTRMRCISQFHYDADACLERNFGEAQDYTVNVIGACGLPAGEDRASVCTVSSSSINGFKVSCGDLNGNLSPVSFSFYVTD